MVGDVRPLVAIVIFAIFIYYFGLPFIYYTSVEFMYKILIEDGSLHLGPIKSERLMDHGLMYEKPNEKSKQIQRVFKGNRVVVLKRFRKNDEVWYKVDYETRRGYIKAKYFY